MGGLALGGWEVCGVVGRFGWERRGDLVALQYFLAGSLGFVNTCWGDIVEKLLHINVGTQRKASTYSNCNAIDTSSHSQASMI